MQVPSWFIEGLVMCKTVYGYVYIKNRGSIENTRVFSRIHISVCLRYVLNVTKGDVEHNQDIYLYCGATMRDKCSQLCSRWACIWARHVKYLLSIYVAISEIWIMQNGRDKVLFIEKMTCNENS